MSISAEVLLTEQRFFLTNQAFMMQSIYIRGKYGAQSYAYQLCLFFSCLNSLF